MIWLKFEKKSSLIKSKLLLVLVLLLIWMSNCHHKILDWDPRRHPSFKPFLTKISKGTIEILNEIHLIKKDEKVGAFEARPLNMLNISPFTYGLVILQIYDSGTIFDPSILDITPKDLRAKFLERVGNVAAVSLAFGYPTAASVPHSIVNGLKNLIAIAVECGEISFPAADKVKEYLKDLSKFVDVAAAPDSSGGPTAEKGDSKKEEKMKESEEEGNDMGFGLFD